MDKQEAALELYLKDWSQARIAQAVNVTESTIVRWKKKDKWDKVKVQKSVLTQSSTDSVWKLIHYQTKALNRKVEEYEKAAEQGEGYQLIDRGNLDALQKLFSIVKKKDVAWIDTIEIATELLEFIQAKDL